MPILGIISDTGGTKDVCSGVSKEKYIFYLQPKVNMKTGEIIGAEALARGVTADGSVISPAVFIDEMEADGSVVQLDFIIYEKVCAFLGERLEKGLPITHTSVNLSRHHMANEETPRKLFEISERYHIPPQYLEFEITERIFLEELSSTQLFIDRLHAYGYTVSVDDYGSGYSGVNVFQDLDFDVLKLDQRFLDLEDEMHERNEVLLPNLIDACHRIDTKVICEGVETREQCLYLLRFDCTLAQGYFFSKPVPPEEFYNTYDKQEGKYPLSMIYMQDADGTGEEADAISSSEHRRTLLRYLHGAIAVGITVFVLTSITFIFRYYSDNISEKFDKMVVENMDSYSQGQREQILYEIYNLQDTLKAVSALVEENDDVQAIRTYVNALNQEETDVQYQYMTRKELAEAQKAGAGSIDSADYRRLMSGELIIGDVVKSDDEKMPYTIMCAVPVTRVGQFRGAMIGVLDAAVLTSTNYFPDNNNRVLWAFLTDAQGNIIPVEVSNEQWAGNVYDYLQERQISEYQLNALKDALISKRTYTTYLGEYDGLSMYLTEINLRYNGWHLIIAVDAAEMLGYSQDVVTITTNGSIALTIVLAVACLMVFIFLYRLQSRHEEDRKRYALVEQFSDTVIFEYDCKKDLISFTPNAREMLHVTGQVSQNFLKHLNMRGIFGGDMQLVYKLLHGDIKDRQEVRVRLLSAQEKYSWYLVKFQYVYDRGRLRKVIGKINDINVQQQKEEYLMRLSQTDKLTGLMDKGATEQMINQYLQRPDRCGVLFMIDVDNFKSINDNYGHKTGDEILQFISECIRRVFRVDDIMGRVGGDEFVVLLKELRNVQAASFKADVLQQMLSEGKQEDTISLTASIGIALAPRDGSDYASLYIHADRAMYEAKKRGKGQYYIYGTEKSQAGEQ